MRVASRQMRSGVRQHGRVVRLRLSCRIHVNFEVRCPGHPSGASVYPQGAKCHVRCRRGFRLEGAHTRHCVSDGHWNGEQPICLREVATDPLYNPSINSVPPVHVPRGSQEKRCRRVLSESLTIDFIAVDTPRPFVSCPQDMDVELPARQNTIRVTFPQPKSNMDWWRYVHASPPWAKQLQADLPAGTTVVTFTAWSPVSNYTSTCRIVIRVRDTENPKVTMCPVSFEVRLSPGERSRLIFWQEPTFTDNVGVEHVYKTRGPGHVMYPGVHNVRYVASDAAGNRAECHFSIHVRGKFMPLCPAGAPDKDFTARGNANGAVATRRETHPRIPPRRGILSAASHFSLS
ncbi:Fibrillin-1 [Temnothorax longispinosus]|uniref:Fibrillin-1 n=1 Tax=Temnothorax longispinosus TaxID=300112 RepID=A0A4S2KVI1_9HYME|nr:Fibrillin-1 [Temnothorax longispinosus]